MATTVYVVSEDTVRKNRNLVMVVPRGVFSTMEKAQEFAESSIKLYYAKNGITDYQIQKSTYTVTGASPKKGGGEYQLDVFWWIEKYRVR